MLERNDELIDRFNKGEQKRQRLERRKRSRRKKAPHTSKALHKLLDRLDEAMERHKPVDCISRKWIAPGKPKGPVALVAL